MIQEITLDTLDFDAKFKELMDKSMPEDIRKGLIEAGKDLLGFAEDRAPKTPWKDGDLRSFGKVEPIMDGSLVTGVSVGYNIIYAARLHEGERSWEWTQEKAGGGVGPKFLETKLWTYGRELMKTVADYLERRLGG